MCTENQLEQLLNTVAKKAKELFSDKLHSVILFGSYARGDYDDESDVDIMILANISATELRAFRSEIDSLCGSLLYDYGVVVSITEKDTETYHRYADVLPFYQNIKKEGVRIA
ncbi:MAG: nucleotidyltransferase domain-containing protein [Clostridia bacterium]|nr:nucleotidyltransferase domain-containing protein [Clostridia bacterium]